jgi:hypothetical protein
MLVFVAGVGTPGETATSNAVNETWGASPLARAAPAWQRHYKTAPSLAPR